MRWAEEQVADVSAVGAALAAIGLRLWILTTPALELDGDEAVTGLVARRILEGEHRAYYAGQHYMGTMEQYLQAAFLTIDRSSSFVLRVPQALLAGVACYLVYRVALACKLRPLRAAFASAMFACGPYFLVFWGAKSRGAYAAAMVLSLLALLLVLTVERDQPFRWSRCLGFGLVCGLAFWNNQQAAFVLVPAVWWLWPHVRQRLVPNAASLAAGFAVGALPAIWHSVHAGHTPFGAGGLESTVGQRFRHFFTGTIPDFLGVRQDEERLVSWFPPPVVFGVAVGLLLVYLAYRHRRGLAAFLLLDTHDRGGRDLLLAILLLAPLISLAVGSSTRGTGRYVFVLFPVALVLVAATPMPRALRTARGTTLVATSVLAALVLHTWYGSRNLIAEEDGGHAVITGEIATEDAAREIATVAEDSGIRTAYADYWLAHLVNWVADGSLVVESIYTPRFEDITAEVRADPSAALIVNRSEVDAVEAALAESGRSFRVLPAGEWRILLDVTPRVSFERPFATVSEALRRAE